MLKIASSMVFSSKISLNIVYVKGMGSMRIYTLAVTVAGNSIIFAQIKRLILDKDKKNQAK